MNEVPSLDIAAGHARFAADCFNAAWRLLDQPVRTATDMEAMIHCAHASLWHWMQRADCQPRNLAIGYWQLARVYAAARHGERSLHYAELSRTAAEGLEPFLRAYALEASGRAHAVRGDVESMQADLDAARRMADDIEDAEDRQRLLADVESAARQLPA